MDDTCIWSTPIKIITITGRIVNYRGAVNGDVRLLNGVKVDDAI